MSKRVREKFQAVMIHVKNDMEILNNEAKSYGEAFRLSIKKIDGKKVEKDIDRLFARIDVFAVRFGRNVGRMALIGIVMHIIAAYFWPEMPEKIPTIYSWFDGWLTFAEYFYRCALKGLYSLFTGNFPTFMKQYSEELCQMWQMFVDWLQSM